MIMVITTCRATVPSLPMYLSLPHVGASAQRSDDIVIGARMALADRRGARSLAG
jgi:hypothetical protein